VRIESHLYPIISAAEHVAMEERLQALLSEEEPNQQHVACIKKYLTVPIFNDPDKIEGSIWEAA